MPNLPAVCDSCGTIFPSGFMIDNVRSATLSGHRAGPCPRCGSMGHVPDGVYDFTDGAVRLLAGPDRTVSELQRFASLLREAQARGASPEEVKNAIRAEATGFHSLGDILPKTPSDLYAFITVLLTIIAIVLSAREKGEEPKIETTQIITNIFEQPQASKPAPREANAARKVGRNEPCPCGSGKKFKRCHGKAQKA